MAKNPIIGASASRSKVKATMFERMFRKDSVQKTDVKMTIDARLGKIVVGLWLLISALLCLSITRQSLWIDEGVTAWLASQPNLGSLFKTLGSLATSESQMPLYVLYAWAWAKLFGTSEIALRASNLPFGLLFLGALAWSSWRVFGRPFLWVIFGFSPFIWYYMNEARPYVAMMAFAAFALAAWLAYYHDPMRFRKSAPWACLVAIFLACGFHMLATFLIPVLGIFALVRGKERMAADRKRKIASGDGFSPVARSKLP